MGLFDWFRKSDQKETSTRAPEVATRDIQPAAVTRSDVDFSLPVSEEEKEIVSVIISAIAAEHYSGRTFRIKDITRIDTDKEIAAAIVGAIAASDKPNANFVLRKIERIN